MLPPWCGTGCHKPLPCPGRQWQRAGGSTSDGERHAIHHAEPQTQGKRDEECGGATAGTNVSGIQLYRRSGGQARHCAAGSGSVQATSPERAKGVSMKTTIEELAPFMRGWRGYFGFCETPEVLLSLTRWVRLRLRAAMWRQWKTPRRRRAALMELGVRERLANNTAGSGRGPWYLAKAKALSVGLSTAYFKSLGLPSPVDE